MLGLNSDITFSSLEDKWGNYNFPEWISILLNINFHKEGKTVQQFAAIDKHAFLFSNCFVYQFWFIYIKFESSFSFVIFDHFIYISFFVDIIFAFKP